MFSKNIENALNEQLNNEFFSWYNYLAITSFFRALNLNGFARWMKSQSQREMMHAMKIYEFLPESGGKAVAHQADISDEQAARGLIDRAVDEFGRIDILINNAGFQHIDPIEAFPEEIWEQMIAVMLNERGWLEELRLCYGRDWMPAACKRSTRGAADDAPAKIWRGL